MDNVRKSKDPCCFGFVTKIASLRVNYSDKIHRSHHKRQQKYVLIGVTDFHVELPQSFVRDGHFGRGCIHRVRAVGGAGHLFCWGRESDALSLSSSAMSEANNK